MATVVRHARMALLVGLIAAFFTAAPAGADVVCAWGQSAYGEVGDGNTTYNRASPVAVSTLTSGVTAIAGGGFHSLAIQNGGVYAWGYNAYGQLGDSTTTNRARPVALSGTVSSGVTAIAGGTHHSLAIQNGGVYAWGLNKYGEVGDGTTTNRTLPLAVGRLSSGVTAIAAGYGHSLAIQNGAIYTWGSNTGGQLGDGTTIDRHIPVAVGSLIGGVTAIAGGDYHSLAVMDGGLYAWGSNAYGCVGDGTTTPRYRPVPVNGLSSGVTAIAASIFSSLAVQNGRVFAWGRNNVGEIGDGTTTNQPTPELIDPTDLHDIVAVAAAADASYALSADGSLWSWGYNAEGQLGLGNTTEYHTPQHLLPPSGYIFTAISANNNGYHAVATLAATPEPASLSLLALGGMVLLRRRTRRNT